MILGAAWLCIGLSLPVAHAQSSACAPSYACAQALVRSATTLGGPADGFLMLDDIMARNEEYKIFSDGHEFAHVIGRQWAKDKGESGDAFLACPRDYYYGCQHGFFESVLATADSPVEAATSVCESAPGSQRFFCYHGVGHGLMMSYAYKLDSVLQKCDQMPSDGFKQNGCWQGAFMENINFLFLKSGI